MMSFAEKLYDRVSKGLTDVMGYRSEIVEDTKTSKGSIETRTYEVIDCSRPLDKSDMIEIARKLHKGNILSRWLFDILLFFYQRGSSSISRWAEDRMVNCGREYVNEVNDLITILSCEVDSTVWVDETNQIMKRFLSSTKMSTDDKTTKKPSSKATTINGIEVHQVKPMKKKRPKPVVHRAHEEDHKSTEQQEREQRLARKIHKEVQKKEAAARKAQQQVEEDLQRKPERDEEPSVCARILGLFC